jgi:predicted acetyltransferase
MMTVRPLRPEEHRAGSDLYRASVHARPADDIAWSTLAWFFADNRVLGAFDGDELAGVATTVASEVSLPGAGAVPVALGASAGVRADLTRRGALTTIVGRVFSTVPEPLVMMWPSESTIYERYGFGPATRSRDVVIDRRRARFRTTQDGDGSVRLLGPDAALADLYHRVGRDRPGRLVRPDGWWGSFRHWRQLAPDPTTAAVHHGSDGVDGYAVWSVRYEREAPTVLTVYDVVHATPEAFRALWRFILSIDLVDEVHATLPPDEPLEELLTDRAAVRTSGMAAETWLRLVDVATALAERSFDGVPVALAVRDEQIPRNSGTYLLGDGPARRTDREADVYLDVSALARLYLGDTRPSALHRAGRLDAVDDAALDRADKLFGAPMLPWCGTVF